MLRHRLSSAARVAVALWALGGARTVMAGGGPENVFLVVNSASWASVTVANHFIRLREIPPSNVLYLDWVGGIESIDGETLRNQILGPALNAVERRGLLGQIDYVIYSSDFPITIDLSGDFAGAKLTDAVRPAFSLNSATYLWHFVFAKTPLAMDLQINHYMREAKERKVAPPVHGFRSWYGWDTGGNLLEAGGQPYMLSTLLAVTSGRGNSVREVVNYLRASASADGTFPAGTIYFSKTDDIRSKVRADVFAPAVAELKKLNVRAEVISTPLPAGRDVQGLMMGAADFSWERSHSKILPGAICDNFTSFGGIMVEGSGQTPLTEFLRYGAAGSSGTVIEPLAIWHKFASPLLQVRYAEGSTLAEAYYQSVFAPVQLLIVGDPLCRPWANIPQVTIAGIKPGEKVSGTVQLKATAKLPKPGKIDRFELFVDGRRTAKAQSGEILAWDSTAETDGYHELRVVAIENSAIESQGRASVGVSVDNHHHTIQFGAMPAQGVRWDQTLKIRTRAPDTQQTFILHNGRSLGQIAGAEGELEINPRRLGLGPVTLHAVAVATASAKFRVSAVPLQFSVEPPKPMPALADPPKKLANGLVLQRADAKLIPVQETLNPAWLAGNGVEGNQAFTLQGYFTVDTDDVYQFELWHFGELKLSVDGVGVYNSPQGDYTEKWVPLSLARGMHRLTVAGRTADDTRLRILFGGPGALALSGKTFRHPMAK